MAIRFTLDRVMFEQGNVKVPELHQKSGVNKNTLYAMYNNKMTRIDTSVIDRICRALQCTPGDLITYTEEGEGL